VVSEKLMRFLFEKLSRGSEAVERCLEAVEGFQKPISAMKPGNDFSDPRDSFSKPQWQLLITPVTASPNAGDSFSKPR
jgi:hypothetical protein